MAATKKKSSTKRKSTTKRKSSKPKGIERVFEQNPFDPGSKVGVYEAFGLPANRGLPLAKPLSQPQVHKDGTLKVRVPKEGRYVLVAETENEGVRRVEFFVKK